MPKRISAVTMYLAKERFKLDDHEMCLQARKFNKAVSQSHKKPSSHDFCCQLALCH